MLPESILELAQRLRTIPGLGVKSSQKMSLDILQMKEIDYLELSNAMKTVRAKVHFCRICGYFAEGEVCEICSSDRRRDNQICIVEKPTDVIALEKSEIYSGVYHILGKMISPLDNVFAENTTVDGLVKKIVELVNIQKKEVELIFFLKPGFSAEATTVYIKEILTQKNLGAGVKITRLAQGLPLYYNPETLDTATMVRALEDRRTV